LVVLELLEVEDEVLEGEMETGPLVMTIDVVEPILDDWL